MLISFRACFRSSRVTRETKSCIGGEVWDIHKVWPTCFVHINLNNSTPDSHPNSAKTHQLCPFRFAIGPKFCVWVGLMEHNPFPWARDPAWARYPKPPMCEFSRTKTFKTPYDCVWFTIPHHLNVVHPKFYKHFPTLPFPPRIPREWDPLTLKSMRFQEPKPAMFHGILHQF